MTELQTALRRGDVTAVPALRGLTPAEAAGAGAPLQALADGRQRA